MALVGTTDPVSVSFSFADNNGNKSQTGLYLPAGITRDALETGVNALRDVLLPVTNATLLGASAGLVFTEDAPVVAPPESEVERKLVLIFRTSNTRQRVRVEVPSPVFGLEQPGTDAVSLTNPLVAALGTYIINGAFGPFNGAQSISGGDIISLERAYIAHRSRPNNP